MERMKIWKGLELEGSDKGFMTLFVGGTHVESKTIVDVLCSNKDVKRVYLGGGRIDVVTVSDVYLLSGYCLSEKISLVIESTANGLKIMPKDLFEQVEQVIVRFDEALVDLLSETDIIKIDTGKSVFTMELVKMISTNLKNLNKDMFSTDVLIYDDEIGGYF